jgi:hypothetical protein
LKNVEEFTRATIKKLTQGMSENNKSMADAKTDEEKEKIVSFISWFVHCVVPCYGCITLTFLHDVTENEKAECYNWVAYLQ